MLWKDTLHNWDIIIISGRTISLWKILRIKERIGPVNAAKFFFSVQVLCTYFGFYCLPKIAAKGKNGAPVSATTFNDFLPLGVILKARSKIFHLRSHRKQVAVKHHNCKTWRLVQATSLIRFQNHLVLYSTRVPLKLWWGESFFVCLTSAAVFCAITPPDGVLVFCCFFLSSIAEFAGNVAWIGAGCIISHLGFPRKMSKRLL